MLGKQRNSSKSTKVKQCNQTEKTSRETLLLPAIANNETEVASKEGSRSKDIDVLKTSINVSDNSATSTDKHVFAVPIAPRNIKPPDQNSLKEEIGVWCF